MNNKKGQWQKTTIGQLGRVITGKTPPSGKPELFGVEYPFITPTDIGNLRYCEPARQLSEQGRNSQRNLLLPANAVCVTCIASVGKMCMTVRPSFTNQQINSVVVDESRYDPFFVYYILQTQVEHLKSIAGGAATPIINKTAFSEIKVSFPSLTIQRRIAGLLSAYDDLIENNTRRIAILEEMAQAIYREWFVNFRFPGHEKVKLVNSPLGKIPEGWEVVKVEDVVKRLSAGKKYDQKTVEAAGDVPVLDQGKSGIIGYHNDEPGCGASLENPVIVFANHTCYQRIILFPFSAIQNVLPFIPAEKHNRNIYWLHWATKDLVKFNDYKGHWPEFIAKQLLLPDMVTCDQFGTYIRPLVHFAHLAGRKNANLRNARDLLLPKLISGQLDVEELDIETGGSMVEAEA